MKLNATFNRIVGTISNGNLAFIYDITGSKPAVDKFVEVHGALLAEGGHEIHYNEKTGAPQFRSLEFRGKNCELGFFVGDDDMERAYLEYDIDHIIDLQSRNLHTRSADTKPARAAQREEKEIEQPADLENPPATGKGTRRTRR